MIEISGEECLSGIDYPMLLNFHPRISSRPAARIFAICAPTSIPKCYVIVQFTLTDKSSNQIRDCPRLLQIFTTKSKHRRQVSFAYRSSNFNCHHHFNYRKPNFNQWEILFAWDTSERTNRRVMILIVGHSVNSSCWSIGWEFYLLRASCRNIHLLDRWVLWIRQALRWTNLGARKGFQHKLQTVVKHPETDGFNAGKGCLWFATLGQRIT